MSKAKKVNNNDELLAKLVKLVISVQKPIKRLKRNNSLLIVV